MGQQGDTGCFGAAEQAQRAEHDFPVTQEKLVLAAECSFAETEPGHIQEFTLPQRKLSV